jgi:hypothetical protein
MIGANEMYPEIQEQQRVINILKGWQFDRKQHGCLFDRGSADSYYGRSRSPHYGGVGGASGERIEDLTAEEVAEYQAGYTYNELYGDRKDYS